MKTNVYEVSETITFTTQIRATNKAEATNRFIEYMGEAIPDSSVFKEISEGIEIEELIPCD